MIDALIHLLVELTRTMEWLQERAVVHLQVVVCRAIKYFVAHLMLMELCLSLAALTILLGYVWLSLI